MLGPEVSEHQGASATVSPLFSLARLRVRFFAQCLAHNMGQPAKMALATLNFISSHRVVVWVREKGGVLLWKAGNASSHLIGLHWVVSIPEPGGVVCRMPLAD